MSYRNPIQVIDTQTGKAIRQTQADLYAVGQNYSQAILNKKKKDELEAEKIRKENEAIQKKKRNYELLIGTKTSDEVRNVSSIFDSTDLNPFENAIDVASDLSIQPVLSQQDRTTFQNINSTPSVIKNDTANIAILDANGDQLRTNIGVQGGGDAYQPSSNWNWANGINGEQGYKRYVTPDYTQPGGAIMNYTVITPDGQEITRTSSDLAKNAQNPSNSTIWQVPDESANHLEIQKTFLKDPQRGFTIANIKDEYFKPESVIVYDDKSAITNTNLELDIEKMRAAIKGKARVKIGSQGEKGMKDRGRISYKNFLASPEGIDSKNFHNNYGENLNDEEVDNLINEYVDFNLTRYGGLNLSGPNYKTIRSDKDETENVTNVKLREEYNRIANKEVTNISKAILNGDMSIFKNMVSDPLRNRIFANVKKEGNKIFYQLSNNATKYDEIYEYDLTNPNDFMLIVKTLLDNRYRDNERKSIEIKRIARDIVENEFDKRPERADTKEEARRIILQNQNE